MVDRHSGIYQGTARCRCSHSTGAITADTVQIERSGCSGTSADSEHLYSITHTDQRHPGAFRTHARADGRAPEQRTALPPQTQGKIERCHRTLKQWLSARPLASSIDELNEQLAEFQHVYNEERPHRALDRRAPGEAYRAKGKALPDPELAARTQTKLDEQRHRETTAGSPGATRRKPIPKDERAEPARVDVTIGPRIHRIDRRVCVTQNNIAGKRRIFNLGKHNAGRMAELLIDHGRAVATDLETSEILVDQTLDTTREYQYRKPANDVNDAPRQM